MNRTSLAPPPLSIVTLALSDKAVANLPHVVSLISSYLDGSRNIPLHEACATGSLDLLDRIWCYNQPPRSKDSRWRPATSLLTSRHYKRWQFSQSLIQAIRRRDLALVDWICRHFTHCVSDVKVVEEAASTGQLEILKFLLEKEWAHTGGVRAHTRVEEDVLHEAVVSRGFRAVDSHRLVDLAASKGHLELLQWLVEQNFLGEEHRVRLSSKHLNVNKWLVEFGLECDVETAFANACFKGRLPVAWWLADYMNTKGIVLEVAKAESAVISAAGRGHLEVIKWLIERNIGRGASQAIRAAAIGGHLEVAKYLHEQGFTSHSKETLERAAKGGHLAVVQWLWTQFKDDPEADLRCVHGGDQYSSRAAPLTRELTAAARKGHLEVVQYLQTIALTLVGKRIRGRGFRYPAKPDMDNVVTEAARSGHLDVVRWVCTHTTVNSTKDAMASAAGNGHFSVVRWLHENRPREDFRTAVLDAAAGCRDLSLLKWLHTNRPNEGWSTLAINIAARRGHLHVLRWLLDHEFLYKDHDRSVPMEASNLALRGGDFDALLFVHYECKNWNSRPVDLKDGSRYNELTEWLREKLGRSSQSD